MAGAQQKCLFHPARTALDRPKLTTADFRFIEAIRGFVRTGIEFQRLLIVCSRISVRKTRAMSVRVIIPWS